MSEGSEILAGQLRQLLNRPDADAELLAQFTAGRDEAAFSALVARHGPLVYRVCRRVLGDVHDAEDAFQATFLVLARRAAAVRPPEALASWLHGVALRVALKARSAQFRRARQEVPPPSEPRADPRPDPLAELSVRELLTLLDEEVRRLPEAYRLPVILCCLEGFSLEEAAWRLGWTFGSVKGRLERGRARLHARLARRGLTLTAALAAVELSQTGGSAAALLPAPTARAALEFAAGRAASGALVPRAAVLAGEAIRSMALTRLKVPLALLLVAGLMAVGFVVHRASVATRPLSFGATTGIADARSKSGEPMDEANRPVEVRGRVVNPAGTPVTGARLYVGYAPKPSEPAGPPHPPNYPERAVSGLDGRFRFTFARSELDEDYLAVSRPAVVAVADGFGFAWAELGRPAANVDLNLKLAEDLPVEGRILDPDGNPTGGAKVRVYNVSAFTADGLARFLETGDRRSAPVKVCRCPPLGRPSEAFSDRDGRFRLAGLGRDRLVTLIVEPPVAPEASLAVVIRPAAELPRLAGTRGATFDYVTLPTRPIRGTVRDKATGRPLAGIKVSAPITSSAALTDRAGHFELMGSPNAPEVVFVQPQQDQPYLSASTRLPEEPGPAPRTVDFDLIGGVVLRGHVIDQGTGKPPKSAVVEYFALFPNSNSAALTTCDFPRPASSASVAADGSYRLTVLPGAGVVLVSALPRNAYPPALFNGPEFAPYLAKGKISGSESQIRVALGNREAWYSINGYHAAAVVRPDEGAGPQTLDFALRPAHRLDGAVVGPDGRPLLGVRVNGLVTTGDAETLEGASFTVEGLGPRRPRELYFDHRDQSLAVAVTLRGDEIEPLTVRLEPCGWVSGRLVDGTGKPVWGACVAFRCGNLSTELTAARTGRDGRFRVGLAPGQRYSLEVSGPRRPAGDATAVEVESGRNVDLGDVSLSR